MSTRKIHKHRCHWLYQTAQKAEPRYGQKSRSKATLFCWQTGKNIRASECRNCLRSRAITCISSVVCALDHKQPMTEKEWNKRHKQRKAKS